MPERSELAAFLRARRACVQPSDVGLPDTGRRRTPGLRREEVAALAGLSIDYLVRLEQGRDSNPSSEVLDALATALRLNDDERAHLFKLASRNRVLCATPACASTTAEIPAGVQALLERLDPAPAFVAGPWLDVYAWNPSWERVAGALGMLDPEARGPDGPNLARFTFLHPRARDVLGDWSAAADEHTSRLRAATVRFLDDDRLRGLVDDLRPSPAFASRWASHIVAVKRRGEKLLHHPDADLRLAYEALSLPDDGELRMITWLPADDVTAAVFAGTPAPGARPDLRVVDSA